jgi:hypothetical protein
MQAADLSKAIKKSQHCQRNWDLTSNIPEADMDLLKTAVSECPSKQNIAFYNVYFVTSRSLIESIHEQTDGFTLTYKPLTTTTNSQVLANLLIVFEPIDVSTIRDGLVTRNEQTQIVLQNQGQDLSQALEYLEKDQKLAIGVAAGYVNLSATLMGYSTGCCSCFDANAIQQLMGLRNAPILLMGVGHSDQSKGRRIHHIREDVLFPAKPKQKISVVEVKD